VLRNEKSAKIRETEKRPPDYKKDILSAPNRPVRVVQNSIQGTKTQVTAGARDNPGTTTLDLRENLYQSERALVTGPRQKERDRG